MLRHLEIRWVDVGLVSVGAPNRASQLIGYDTLRHAAKVLEASNRRADEVGKLLRERGLCKRVVARAHRHHEELHLSDFASLAVGQTQLLPRVVDEGALPCNVHLSHRRLSVTAPCAI